MKRTLTLILALAAGLAATANAQQAGGTAAGIYFVVAAPDQTQGAGSATATAPNPPVPGPVVEAQTVPRLPEGTPVVVVGEVVSPPRTIIREHKAQVAIGPARMAYTLHLSHATVYDRYGAVIKPRKLSDKMWVRAEGTVMNDPRRIQVKQLQVIGTDPASLRQSAFYRPGFDQGYIIAVAGTRQTYPQVTGVAVAPPPVTIVGEVVDDTGPLKDSGSAARSWSGARTCHGHELEADRRGGLERGPLDVTVPRSGVLLGSFGTRSRPAPRAGALTFAACRLPASRRLRNGTILSLLLLVVTAGRKVLPEPCRGPPAA